jgi:hypothetical protein
MVNDELLTSLSHSTNLADLAEFWDTHDATEFDAQTEPVAMQFALAQRHHYVAIDPDLLFSVRRMAQARGLSAESLINLWLQERVLSQASVGATAVS